MQSNARSSIPHPGLLTVSSELIGLSEEPSPALPLALLTLERPPSNYIPQFGTFRVGMVVYQHQMTREQWDTERPWEAPERTPRMAAMVTQVLAHCEQRRWSFDLLLFPAGTLNYYGQGSVQGVLEAREVQRIAGALRRARQVVRAMIFGVGVQGRPPPGEAVSGPTDDDRERWQFAVAMEAGDIPMVYQQQTQSPDQPGVQRCAAPGSESGGTEGHRIVTLADRKIRLSLLQEQFEGASAAARVRRQLDDVDLWVNPLDMNHPGGGSSPGKWPVARVEKALRNETVPIFLPHHRRSGLEGPFWFAGHPRQARPHRWQPEDETLFRSRDGCLQLLTFDFRV